MKEIPAPFVPTTQIIPQAQGIQIISLIAPSVTLVTSLTIDELGQAMKACLALRQSQKSLLASVNGGGRA